MTASKSTAPKSKPATIELGADLSPAVAAIEKAYRMIQRRYADAPDVTIVVKRDERAWGHTTVHKLWAPSAAAEQADRFEIMISGENLRRGADAVAATLIHEAAHARNLNNGIRDTDTNGRHNLKFKATAEGMGLVCTCHNWHGWTLTELTDDGRVSWRQLLKVIAAGLAKSAVVATPTLTPVATGTGTATPTGGASGPTILVPPKRGNRNLLKAMCACGHSIRVSRGVLDAAQPTCQACGSVFTAV